jgi:DNA-binding NtrC family response regulator
MGNIKTLRFSLGLTQKQSVQSELVCRPAAAMGEFMKSQTMPVAFLIREPDIKKLTALGNGIVDRGVKTAPKPLSLKLLGQSSVPLIRARYSSGRQVGRSIWRLLDNALNSGDSNCYIIAVAGRIFEYLWQRSVPAEDAPPKKEPDWNAPSIDSQTRVAHLLLEALGNVEVDPLLEETYVGASARICYARVLTMRAADCDDPVLILGETGTGKEIIAHAIHRLSKNRKGPFVDVNCAAIPTEMFEAELFGHQKDAFTNANYARKGLWAMADGGTLFLDEIGDMPFTHQAKILRCIEDGMIRRIGSNKGVKIRARVIAATNVNLFAMTQEKRFREDLFNRLRIFMIPTPPLEDCPEDIPRIAQKLWKDVTGGKRKPLSVEVISMLRAQPWPGNVRGLKTAMSKLHRHYVSGRITRKHVELILLQDQLFGSVSPKVLAQRRKAYQRLTHLRRLRETEEAVLACQHALKPLAQTKTTPLTSNQRQQLQFALLQRLEELEMLCLDPLEFPGEATFFTLCRFKKSIADLHNQLCQNHKKTSKTHCKQTDQAIEMILRALQQDANNLLMEE